MNDALKAMMIIYGSVAVVSGVYVFLTGAGL
jgi:hypothetical protein